MKRIACFILSIALLLTLCACGSNNIPEATGTNQQNMPNTNQPGVVEDIAPEDRPAIPADYEYTLSEYLATGDTIWYMFESNKGKESQVTYIYVLTADGYIYWYRPYPHILLGELEQMADADIIAMVKEAYPRQQFGYEIFTSENEYIKCVAREAIFQREVILFDSAKYYLDPDAFTAQSLYAYGYENGGFMPTFVQNAVEENWDIIEQTYYELWQCMAEHGSFVDFFMEWILPTRHPEEIEGLISQSENIDADAVNAFMEIFYKMNDVVEVVFADYNAQAEAYCETIEPAAYALAIITDSTGNNTEAMYLAHTARSQENTYVTGMTLSYEYPAGQNHSNCHTVVYDSLYGGYIADHDDYLYTRVSGKLHFMLDAVGTYDIPIDVKDYETLFD